MFSPVQSSHIGVMCLTSQQLAAKTSILCGSQAKPFLANSGLSAPQIDLAIALHQFRQAHLGIEAVVGAQHPPQQLLH